MLPRYADIIIDISHEAIDRPFQYRIPDDLREDIRLGSMVKIPFGRGNHLRTGYVIGFSDQTEYQSDRIKEIAELCDRSVPVEGRLLALAAWIRENYGSTMINAIRTVMPVKKTIRQLVDQVVVLAENMDTEHLADIREQYHRKHAQAKLRLLQALEETPERYLSMDVVKQKWNISPATLKTMQQDGVITVISKERYRTAGVYDYKENFQITLNNEQQAVVDEVTGDMEQGRQKTYLLHGITGSGKTEVYVKIVKKTIEMGKQAIILIPEIALTYQTVRYFRNYFGDRVTIINSRLSDGEKYDQFMRAKNGDVDVVIGPRSALFAPFQNLGIIIIDEEHETSYKSDYPPKYHARETAVKRAELEHASVLLGSATPSVESYHRALNGTYRLLELHERAGSGQLAKTSIVDLRKELKAGNRSIISRELADDIADRLARRQQVMLFINKRGYNSFVSCRNCGEALKCPHCDVSLTRHENNRMICHYCGFQMPQPKVCPSCHSGLIGGYGTGTQKLEEEVQRLFPQARVLRMDKDTTAAKDAHEQILEKFGNGEADILVGTQMIVKGHDFSNVTLVGIILADLTLFQNDYRAGERTFDLITQAAGRAGRGTQPGKVVIQTYKPEHYAIKAAAAQNYLDFYKEEEAYRGLMKYPPEWNMMVVLMVCSDETFLDQMAEDICSNIRSCSENDRDMRIIGPSAPVIAKIRDIYRRVVYIKNYRYNELVALKDQIEIYVSEKKELQDFSLQFDFNPLNMY